MLRSVDRLGLLGATRCKVFAQDLGLLSNRKSSFFFVSEAVLHKAQVNACFCNLWVKVFVFCSQNGSSCSSLDNFISLSLFGSLLAAAYRRTHFLYFLIAQGLVSLSKYEQIVGTVSLA